ncbi:hypothetical protein SPRG_21679 [Saprolegnia parasitica CBS 223.65]|uniref:TatD DNase n=1 Tax=Saprolegnia parasitica (strain CBS 223.65) TaxID=695850 RepID=A0A067BJC7_SAPPC|nr:hypothetical protein SPRG_21679 [Saprolegnia parasitica CBS 223.65]KDO18539.1 hypothetical protein SPRG_21679 [Saprolegnia parasitica CBS 223.65]|eukprot:XP_012210747.1 hypothetical protein SPRG_21679 [Saprolegnia parasitica CBS 223.65]
MSSDDSKSAPVAAPAMDAKAMKVAKRAKKLQKASTPIAPVRKLPAWLTPDIDLFDFDCAALIAEAKEARVKQMLVPGATLAESQQCLDLARLYPTPFVAALTERAAKLPPAVVHCFTGTAAEAATYVSMGLYIGVTGFICKSHGATLQSLLRDGVVPLDRLVVETDAPYMGFPHCRKLAAAHPKKQYPNVATALPSVVEALAECLGLPAKDVAAATTYNARKFLRLL